MGNAKSGRWLLGGGAEGAEGARGVWEREREREIFLLLAPPSSIQPSPPSSSSKPPPPVALNPQEGPIHSANNAECGSPIAFPPPKSFPFIHPSKKKKKKTPGTQTRKSYRKLSFPGGKNALDKEEKGKLPPETKPNPPQKKGGSRPGENTYGSIRIWKKERKKKSVRVVWIRFVLCSSPWGGGGFFLTLPILAN